MTHIHTQRPGRPKRHPVDALFTRLWVSAVKIHAGLSVHAIEQELEPHLVRQGADGVKRSRKWHLYESGERVPPRKPGQPCSVELAESKFPGTAAYFDAPMKTVLRRDVVDVLWLDEALAALAPEVARLLFKPTRSDIGYWHPLAFDEHCANQLIAVGSFDALQAAALLMAKAELIASPKLRDLAWQAYVYMQPAVEASPVVAPLAGELFRMIDLTLKRWVYFRPDRRQEVVFFTNKLRDKNGVVDMARIREGEVMMKFMIESSEANEGPPAEPPAAPQGAESNTDPHSLDSR